MKETIEQLINKEELRLQVGDSESITMKDEWTYVNPNSNIEKVLKSVCERSN